MTRINRLLASTAIAAVLIAPSVTTALAGGQPHKPTTTELNAIALAGAKARASAASSATANATAPTVVSGGSQSVTFEDKRDWFAPSMPAPGAASPRACSHVVGIGIAGPFAGLGGSWRSDGDDVCEIEAFEPAVAEWDILPATVRALYCTAQRIRDAGLCGGAAQADARHRPMPAFPE